MLKYLTMHLIPFHSTTAGISTELFIGSSLQPLTPDLHSYSFVLSRYCGVLGFLVFVIPVSAFTPRYCLSFHSCPS